MAQHRHRNDPANHRECPAAEEFDIVGIGHGKHLQLFPLVGLGGCTKHPLSPLLLMGGRGSFTVRP
jgi:hypothetical protein